MGRRLSILLAQLSRRQLRVRLHYHLVLQKDALV